MPTTALKKHSVGLSLTPKIKDVVCSLDSNDRRWRRFQQQVLSVVQVDFVQHTYTSFYFATLRL
jgi:hypothetical protein